MHPYLNTAVKAARRAGDIIVRGLARFEGMETASKGLNDFVTSIDLAAEAAIIETLRDAYPHHAFLAEESGASGDGEIVWIIDPLDGTTNFIHGFPHYAVSIALSHRGIVTQAVIYDPGNNDLFTATRGAGAYLNDTRIRVGKRAQLKAALVGTGFPFKEHRHIDAYLAMLRDVMQSCSGVRRAGSAALDLAYLAAGRLDAFWEIGLAPWDIAAGSLLITEAGGAVADLQGNDGYLKSGNVVGGNLRLLHELLQLLGPHLTPALKAA